MATQKQPETARKNVKKAQSGARQKRTISKLSKDTRSALGIEGRSKMGKAQLVRAVGQKRRSS
jgi:hypothetical protein